MCEASSALHASRKAVESFQNVQESEHGSDTAETSEAVATEAVPGSCNTEDPMEADEPVTAPESAEAAPEEDAEVEVPKPDAKKANTKRQVCVSCLR